jgi:hypothetical protein
LFTLANMPIQRFGSMLISKGQLQRLPEHCSREAFSRDANLDGVMCRSLVSIDWQGYLYDCDFNQQLGLAAGRRQPACRLHMHDHAHGDRPCRRNADPGSPSHCYGCTAGPGVAAAVARWRIERACSKEPRR